MICDCCRRDVDYTRESFWHRDARICRECFANWCNPDNDQLESTDTASIGNYVRLRHGLPPIAAALAIMALALATTAQAARHCLDQGEAARTWPTRALVKDEDGCWTYDHHKPRVAEATSSAQDAPAPKPATITSRPEMLLMKPETVTLRTEPKLMERWPEASLVRLEAIEPEFVPEERPSLDKRHLALFVSLVLAVASVVEVATGRLGSAARAAGRWPARGRTHWTSRT
jgi:hypothetical protein